MTSNYHHHKVTPEIVYSCEICGQDDLNESQMRLHMESIHLKGAVQCPFCDLSSSDVSANEMTLHVNTAHLEYLTPEREDVAFLEDYDNSDFDSIWQLEKDAKEGLTNGVDESPTQANKYLNFEAKGQSSSSPMSTSTEVSSESPLHTSSMMPPAAAAAASMASASGGAIQKRFKLCNSANASPSKSGLSLSIKPNWAPLEEAADGGGLSHDKLHRCPLCEHACKDPVKLEEHVNRVHFDPQSPAEAMKNLDNTKTPTCKLPCPLCTAFYSTSLELERHVNHDHSDVLSPMTTKKSRRPSSTASPTTTNDFTTPSSSSSSTSALRQLQQLNATAASSVEDGNGNQECCPVCNVGGFHNQNQLAEHIESHFNEPPKAASSTKSSQSTKRNGGGDGHSISSMSSSSSTSSSSTSKPSNDYLLAQELERRERERRKHEEQREFNQLRAQFGMDNDGNFHSQSISNMQNAVYRGEMSVVDYYERQSELRNAEKSGMDDGRSVTKHLMPKLRNVCQTTTHGVAQTYLCSVVDHHSSSFGDKGWGCGYRNLQMLLSSLAHHTPYAERLGITKGMGVASISRLQAQIEAAWRKGFDVQGSDQLGGKLVNTRKWIGATEIVAFFSSNHIKTELLDFHSPSAKDGTHPKLFQWVLDYFRQRASVKAFTPPLYLQHQGHSRTIVGIEVLASSGSNNLRLLVFDPSHSRASMTALSKSSSEAGQAMRMLRKAPSAIKCKQYQIVAVTGLFTNDKEANDHQVIRSKRIP